MRLGPFHQLVGVAAPLMKDNIDTDQIIPSREMNKVSESGLAEGLFAGWRYKKVGARELDSDFVLNQPDYNRASILLAGENFGCGSSREHAVWAIREYGLRVIIAPSFGEIFYANCFLNGVLAIRLPRNSVLRLISLTQPDPQKYQLHVDLPNQKIFIKNTDKASMSFDIDAYPKKLLTEGLDPIGLTLASGDQIAQFLDTDRMRRPWVYL